MLKFGARQEVASNDATRYPLFRPIHYLGSKLRLAHAIADALDDVDDTQGTVLDLFTGSGTTALALARHRRVVASDIQEYSRVLCSALLIQRQQLEGVVSTFEQKLHAGSPLVDTLRYAIEPLIEFERMALEAATHGDVEAICSVLESGSILAAERGIYPTSSPELSSRLQEVARRLSCAGLTGSAAATAVRYFGGAYFSYEQALELDCMAAVANECSTPDLADVFTAALLSTASDTVNTVGKQFAQPIRPRAKHGGVKHHLLSKIERDRGLSVRTSYLEWLARYASHQVPNGGNVVVRSDYREALQLFGGQYSVVYADPPYTRDHYSRFYHVLETIARRDNPSIARNPGASDNELSRGLYRDDRHQSPFCIKSQCAGAFRDLFQLASGHRANMVVSYSPFDAESGARPRLMHINDLLALAKESYDSVELQSVDGVSHSKLNHSSLNYEMPKESEVIVICRLKR